MTQRTIKLKTTHKGKIKKLQNTHKGGTKKLKTICGCKMQFRCYS